MFITWNTDTTPEARLADYDAKKAYVRGQTASWPPLPPEDLTALPEAMQRAWETVTTLRSEYARQRRAEVLLNLSPRWRPAYLACVPNAVIYARGVSKPNTVIPFAAKR